MCVQVPRVLLSQGPGVLLQCPAASQAGAVGDEGSDQDVEGAGRRHPGPRQIQGQPSRHDCHRLGQRSVCESVKLKDLLFFTLKNEP